MTYLPNHFIAPTVALGTAAAEGSAATLVRSNATLVAFDATAPVTQASADVAATGSAAFAARRDHKHGMPTITLGDPTPVMVSALSRSSIGGELAVVGSSPADLTWPSANLAVYIPFTLAESITAYKMWVFNGAAVSGNLDIGIYNEAGTKLIATGSTAQSGTTAIQTVDVADTALGPGTFYLALVLDNGTGKVRQQLFSTSPTIYPTVCGIAQESSAFPLPASFTLATNTTFGGGPVFGFSRRTLVS